MKYAIFACVALLSFVGTLAGVLAATGNLSLDKFKQTVSPPAEEAPKAKSSASDPMGPLAEALKQKEEALVAREKDLAEREARIEQREEELNRLRTEVEGMQTELSTEMDKTDAERKARLQTKADTLEAMRPENAAETLKNMPEEEAAAVLSLVPVKQRGKIMDAIGKMKSGDGDFSTKILQALENEPL